ncbi:Holliday junction resolvase-like protein [Acinetobacter sp. ANC 3791]|uniref:Holliday junction resolvase-like protein n=1 Tax=Acinetobacter sp. ANC 3791 TaxID=2529836 RepID=UPI00103D4B96|nr:Holliday junction resolvase-like protein [Acinetobacter sp. ANC 3791]TCB84835.1 endonuclease [Acinetobacter sp. ANC 3791]
MPIWIAMVIGLGIGVILTYALLSNLRNGKIQAEYEVQISELKRKYQKELRLAQSRSVNSSRAILKGRMAEQFAPIFPEFEYLPSDAKFLGDPVDYVVFNGYNAFRDGDGRADEIEVVLIDIKSGNARLTKGQQAIADAIKKGRIRFETIRVEFED